MEQEVVDKILIFGSKGMAGHLITDYLTKNSNFKIITVARGTSKADYNIDITDICEVESLIKLVKPKFLINAIGVLNNDAETNPDKAIFVNSYFPHFLARICKSHLIKLIHISTDCVFSGKKGNYIETDKKDGVGFYAQTKSIGEVFYDHTLTIRTSIIGPEINNNGIGLFDWVFKNEGTIIGYSNAYWSGVTTLELAKAIFYVISNNIDNTNLIHLTNNTKINKYELITLINETFGLNLKIDSNHSYIVDKSILNTNSKFNYIVPTYQEMLIQLKNWMIINNDLYKKYF